VKKTVFLVDLDNVLIDTEKFRDTPIPDLENFPFEKYIFPNAKNLLNILKSLGEVFIYSRGDPGFQKAKLKSGGIDKIIDPEHTIVLIDKIQALKEIISKFNDAQVTIIDDRPSVLSEAQHLNPKIETIWIKYGKYINEMSNPGNFTFVADNLDQVLAYFYQLSLASFAYPYKIRKTLNEKQIRQLLDYTKKDTDIQKFTSDSKRFKDRPSFDQWIKKDRVIYCLSDNKDNLMGIIWFSKEEFEPHEKNRYYKAAEYPYTFAIRMYANARGKGLAKPFMNFCFKDFGKKGIWLTTSKDNIPAIKLYTNFGFKEIPDVNPYNKIVMVYKNNG